MKKRIAEILCLAVLAGCSSSKENASATVSASAAAESSTPAATETAEASASAETAASIPTDAQTVEGVVEQELPQTLKITMQDVSILFTKDLNYTGDTLAYGDEVILTYTGDLENHPTVLTAVKK